MSETLQTLGNGKMQEDFMIVSRVEDGFRVYSAIKPESRHLVSGNLSDPACTCDAFAEDTTCEHVRAVQRQFEDARVAQEERLAIQAEGQPSPKKKRKINTNGSPATMTLKRSVSPDGRIDSLSVELSCPIDQVPAADIKSRATRMLNLQREIAGAFLSANSRSNGNGPSKGNGYEKSDNGVPAKMLSIGSTRNGNFSISFQANGKGAKFFGSQSEIAQAIRDAGFQYSQEDVADGVFLNLPCRVITKPTADGRYVNVNRVLPAASHRRTAS